MGVGADMTQVTLVPRGGKHNGGVVHGHGRCDRWPGWLFDGAAEGVCTSPQITLIRGETMRLSSGVSIVGALLLAMTFSQPAAAQVAVVTAPPLTAPLSTAPEPLGPTLAAARVGFSDDYEQPTEVNAAASKMGKREGRALALVGGAAVIAGLLIGDDAGTVIAIGGAGLGLYGLYVWQR
jgi:hypothetical protein